VIDELARATRKLGFNSPHQASGQAMRSASAIRRGFSLLELVISASMLAVLMVAIGGVLRTSRQAWEAHEGDYQRLDALHATVRHIVRSVRQADGVTEISAAGDTSGRLGLLLVDGSTVVWDHDSITSKVNYGVTTPTNLLAENITTLRFTGYRADGVTATTTTNLVQNIMIEASVTLPREAGGTKTISSWAWVRSW
jgi:prepilin-type N-terminal cleavage/methylation domain-containing protein